MSSSPEISISRFKELLDPFIKPREQINFIRRVLALELGSYTVDGPLRKPLLLDQDSIHRVAGPELRGIHREYIEALQAHELARQQYESAAGKNVSPDRSSNGNNVYGTSFAEDHLMLLRLRRKRESLLTIQSCIQRLAVSPATRQASADLQEVLEPGRTRPNIPNEVINSFGMEHTSSDSDLPGRSRRLEKSLLKANLLLKQEKQLLADARVKYETNPEVTSNEAKLQALNDIRSELISWIETELSNVSTEDKGDEDESKYADSQSAADDYARNVNQLQQIRDQYRAYTTARNELITLMSLKHPPSMASLEWNKQGEVAAETREPLAAEHILAPYIEALISQSRIQKALITHKSHFLTALGGQSKDASQVLGRLAEESQLLTIYPSKTTGHQRSCLPEMTAARPADRADMADRIKPWINAVDAAKIESLEAVADRVESGQAALEHSIAALHDLELSLGLEQELKVDNTGIDVKGDDMWLREAEGKEVCSEKPLHKIATPSFPVKTDPWTELHGYLGLVSRNDVL